SKIDGLLAAEPGTSSIVAVLLRFDPGFLGCRRPALRLGVYKRREGFGRVTHRLETVVQDSGLHVWQAHDAADLHRELVEYRLRCCCGREYACPACEPAQRISQFLKRRYVRKTLQAVGSGNRKQLYLVGILPEPADRGECRR